MNTDVFKSVGEALADERGRLPMAKTGVRKDDRYAVAVNDDGQILLTPLVSIPRRELIVWENQMLRESLARGLAEAATGQTENLGSFAQYADDDVED
ncbi:hypothetical protein SAMN02745244_03301 [Tessaracoccus bendigoensis DSM 12906]|uniref:Uncharacterized protein n=1 Tax=Tessaracoccus bendigoensis DSM 12906 TaxID=1123357 RepID=A0A1M6MB77_9ACTN|nr:hypothetical protein [Tessaracoccus bendigoensis]SHJ80543.1 hypothetical protein SAMN02745244_03301 [Tessaracoccus bendigoensis DSM 12906]